MEGQTGKIEWCLFLAVAGYRIEKRIPKCSGINTRFQKRFYL